MHKLDRTTATAPACLALYDYRTQTWDDLLPVHKEEIRASLRQLQDVRCAYCEGLYDPESHIEHFRRKNQAYFPSLTFVWSNLFLACGAEDHCGHFKDRRGTPYNPCNIIKPDDDDPDDFLYFHSSGEVRARSGIGPANTLRARETIRVFNLDLGSLRAARRRSLEIYEKREPGILEALIGFEAQDRQEFIRAEVQATKAEPHWAVVRHFFEKAH